MNFADRIRSYRFMLNLSQQELARAVLVSARTVRNWERGRPVWPEKQQRIEALLDKLLAEKKGIKLPAEELSETASQTVSLEDDDLSFG